MLNGFHDNSVVHICKKKLFCRATSEEGSQAVSKEIGYKLFFI